MKTLLRYTSLCLLPFLTGCGSIFTSLNSPPVVYQSANNLAKTQVVTQYVPVPIPGQLMYLKNQGKNLNDIAQTRFYTKEAAVNYANQQAMRYPRSSDFFNTIMNYPYMEGALYVIYTSPQRITDLQFAPGEKLISQAAGDTVRWQVAKTYSGTDQSQVEHLLVKPLSAPLENNMVIMTSQHVYHLKLVATNNTYMSAVQWVYTDPMVTSYQNDFSSGDGGGLSGLEGYNVNINNMHTSYRITSVTGDTSTWMPNFVFDDGTHTYIRFPQSSYTPALPLLMVDIGNNNYSTTINYRQKGQYMIVDGLFQHARLVLGDTINKNQAVVQIDQLGSSK